MAIRKRGSVWYIDYYDPTGKRHMEAVGPKKDAEAALGGIKKDIREGKWFPRKLRSISFDTIVDQYEALKKDKKGYVSEETYIGRARGFFKGRIAHEITVQDVEGFKAHLAALPTRGGGKRSGTDVNAHLNCLRAILNKAIKWGAIEKNPALGGKVERFPVPPGRNEYLTAEQAGRLLDGCSAPLRPIVLCALETGMRKAEILGLRWPEIRNEMIYLPGERTKNGKPREIPMSARLADELKRLRTRRRKEEVSTASDLVFPPSRVPKASKRGKLRVVEDIRGAWEAAKKKAGIDPGFHFHDLRHTFASHQKMAGVDDFTLMELLGHSDMKMMKRYAHLSPEHKRKAVEALPEWKAENSGDKMGTHEG